MLPLGGQEANGDLDVKQLSSWKDDFYWFNPLPNDSVFCFVFNNHSAELTLKKRLYLPCTNGLISVVTAIPQQVRGPPGSPSAYCLL